MLQPNEMIIALTPLKIEEGTGVRPQIIDSKYWRGHGVRIQCVG
jgi:hypothetical protein